MHVHVACSDQWHRGGGADTPQFLESLRIVRGAMHLDGNPAASGKMSAQPSGLRKLQLLWRDQQGETFVQIALEL